ncbi:MAG: 3-deoxy-D-manno-octulosonic acid transferase [Candidatus Omnitrophica bacterium]|nr:3-deoxy-D-manno-octulosonic acid transferase [Candidatus Omnitrophota bacterium]
MFILYDLFFLFFALIYLPYSLAKRKINAGIFQRMGFLRLKQAPGAGLIWLHAVSVGEVMAIKAFVRDTGREFSRNKIVISTVTTTGNKLAVKLFGNNAQIFYLPFDLSFIIKRVIRRIKPCLFIAVETELWPNLLSYLKQSGVPTAIVNGRISDRSFKGYYRMKFLFKPILNKVSLFCVRSDQDARRLVQLGVDDKKVKITGNMKFDLEISAHSLDIGLKSDEKLFVCGSTHPREEEILLGVYRQARRQFPDLRLLVAPRHIERCGEIEGLARKMGFDALRISRIKAGCPAGRNCVFLLDIIGELPSLYNMADVVFIGGSLIEHGGHNIIEPAFFGKPIVFGRHMSNFRDIAEMFLKDEAAIQVKDEAGLGNALKDILGREDVRQKLGNNARSVVEKNRGAVARTIEEIGRILEYTPH